MNKILLPLFLILCIFGCALAGDSLQVVEFRQYNVHFTGEVINIDTVYTDLFWTNVFTGVYTYRKNGIIQYRYREHGWEVNKIGDIVIK